MSSSGMGRDVHSLVLSVQHNIQKIRHAGLHCLYYSYDILYTKDEDTLVYTVCITTTTYYIQKIRHAGLHCLYYNYDTLYTRDEDTLVYTVFVTTTTYYIQKMKTRWFTLSVLQLRHIIYKR